MAATTTSERSTVPVPLAEAPVTLAEDAPRTLSLLDQFGFWGNLGVSLFGLTTASTILYALPDKPLPLIGAIAAAILRARRPATFQALGRAVAPNLDKQLEPD